MRCSILLVFVGALALNLAGCGVIERDTTRIEKHDGPAPVIKEKETRIIEKPSSETKVNIDINKK